MLIFVTETILQQKKKKSFFCYDNILAKNFQNTNYDKD